MKPNILLVDDDRSRCADVQTALRDRFDTTCAYSVEDAFHAMTRGTWPTVVVAYDLAAGGSGLEVLQAFRESSPRTFRIAYARRITGGVRHDVVRLAYPHAVLDGGAAGFAAEVRGCLDKVFAETPAPSAGETLDPVTVGGRWTAIAPASLQFLDQLREGAESERPVFLYGEPGSGKTRAAAILQQWRAAWKTRGGSPRGPEGFSVCILRVPPLRERIQDLPVLAVRCLAEHARDTGEPIKQIAPRSLDDLLAREWRGNIIELRAVMLRACQRAGTRSSITPEDLPHDAQPSWRPSQYAKDEGQRECVLRQLRIARNVSGAARLEGSSRANYIRLMRRLGIIRADIRMDVEESV